MTKECFQTIRLLRSDNDILITKSDKGAGAVILSKHDYVSKMDTLLHDTSKFENLGPTSQDKNAAKVELQIQRRLLELKKKNLIPVRVYEAIRPTDSQRPRMYGLANTHKKDMPLRPILSMTGSTQHQLVKWLTSIFDPVLQLFTTNCVPDSFTFVETSRNFRFPTSFPFLRFF